MNSEADPPSTENPHPVSVPLFLSSSSSSLKPLRERNRTNLKRRIHLSRSQVLSEDFENEDRIPSTSNATALTKNASNHFSSTTQSQSQPAPSTRKSSLSVKTLVHRFHLQHRVRNIPMHMRKQPVQQHRHPFKRK